MPATIGNRLREIRIEARLTQREMSREVGLSPGAIGALENNLYTPNYEVLRTIHRKFGTPYEFIIDGIKTESLPKLIEENKELKKEVERLKKMIDKLL